MSTIRQLPQTVKSANAGASWLTFDIVFADPEGLQAVWDSQVIGSALFAQLYQVDADSVRVFRCDAINTIKVTIPRRSGMGGPDETDFDGVQQFAPLLDVDVPV